MEPGIGLIGCGVMGRVLAKLVTRQDPGLRVVALYDPDPGSVAATRASFEGPPRVHPSHRALIDDPEVAWVMIASWNRFHAGQVMDALAAGKHVFCQKPLATDLEEAVALAEAWRTARRHVVLGFTLRFAGHYRRIHERLRAGAIGRLVSFEQNETLEFNHGGYIMGDWRRLRRNAGTHLLEKCCHDIDLLHWLSGSRPRRVASFGGLDVFTPENAGLVEQVGRDAEGREAYRTWPSLVGEHPFLAEKDIVDNQVALIELESGVRGTFHTNCNAGIPERRLLLCGTEGAIRADLVAGTIEERRIGFDTRTQRLDATSPDRHGGGDTVLARELADCMLGGTAPAAGFREGLEATLSCLAIDRALDEGEVVDLAPTWERIDARLGDPGPSPRAGNPGPRSDVP